MIDLCHLLPFTSTNGLDISNFMVTTEEKGIFAASDFLVSSKYANEAKICFVLLMLDIDFYEGYLEETIFFICG